MKSNDALFRSEEVGKKFFFFGVALHVIFLLSLAGGFLNPLFDDATHRVGQGADFYAVYQAGQNVVDGVSIYLKDPHTMVVPYCYVYRYLPFSAYTFGQLFRLFSPQVAYVLWILALAVLLLLNLKLTKSMFHKGGHGYAAMALWLLFSPYYLELYMGQFSFFMTTLFFWMMYYWMNNRDAAGDGLWIFSLLVKTNSALFVPLLLKLKKWKSVLMAMLVVALFSLPYFFYMKGSFSDFAWNFTEGLSVETLAGNQGIAALLAVTLLRSTGHWAPNINLFFQNIEVMNTFIRTPLLAWSFFVYGVSLMITVRTSVEYTTELFLVWILTYFLTYKHVWEHQYVMLLPVFLYLFQRLYASKERKLFSPKIFWLAFVIVALPTPFIFIDKVRVLVDPEFYWSTAESLAFHTAKPLAVLALYTALVFSLWKYGRHVPPKMANQLSNVAAEAA